MLEELLDTLVNNPAFYEGAGIGAGAMVGLKVGWWGLKKLTRKVLKLDNPPSALTAYLLAILDSLEDWKYDEQHGWLQNPLEDVSINLYSNGKIFRILIDNEPVPLSNFRHFAELEPIRRKAGAVVKAIADQGKQENLRREQEKLTRFNKRIEDRTRKLKEGM